MKRVHYRGGLVTFHIPDTWVEEHEEDGGGTFYEPRPDSGTLRLSVLTLEPSAGTAGVPPIALLESPAQAELGELRELPNGNALLTYTTQSVEGAIPIRLVHWQIAQRVTPERYRLALFTYTLAVEHEHEPVNRRELEFLRVELPAAVLTPIAGELDGSS